MVEPTDPRLRARHLEQLLNAAWPKDASTTPDRRPIPVRVRLVWSRSGEEAVDGRATRWSGRCVFVETATRDGTLGLWVDASDVARLPSE